MIWPLLIAAAVYLGAAVVVRRRGGWWPAGRTAYWLAGLGVSAGAVAGPLAAAAHHDFTAHMTVHLMLGMAVPLLLVHAAPVTLALRALPAGHARRLSRVLGSRPLRVLTHPVTAAALNGGGLWLLYTTGLHTAMSTNPWVHAAVHAHMLAAGYLFTAALIGIDPTPHRPGHPIRAVALVGFLAAHAILAKYLYGHPPPGMPEAGTRTGAVVMYYGGDLVDLALIVAFCRQWYRGTAAPRIPTVRPPEPRWHLPSAEIGRR